MHQLVVALTIALCFAPIGAIMAGIITYIEYAKHRLEKGRALREAAASAALAFLLLTACAVAGVFLF